MTNGFIHRENQCFVLVVSNWSQRSQTVVKENIICMYDYDYELYTMIIELSPFKLFHKLDNDQEFQL